MTIIESPMNSQKFPLLDFFTRLRHAGLPLGISDYQVLLKAFQGGFGIKDTASLKRVCKALWVKSEDDERLFDYQFSLIEPELKQRQEIVRASKRNEIERAEEKPETTSVSEPETIAEEMPQASSPPPLPSPESQPPEYGEPDPALSSDLMQIKDEAEAAQMVTAVQSNYQNIEEITHIPDRFILKGNYFPITRRQMKQTCRYLRCYVREGNRKEIDVDATVNDICRQGIFLEPVMVPCRINRLELVLLIDQNGSMVPFHALSQRLKETAIRGGRMGKIHVYYFHNVPGEWLYKDTALIEADKTDDVLKQLHRRYAHVLIISDAGAARGSFNLERLKLTGAFLDKLKMYVSHMAWLNPMPRFRWLGTSADEIEQHIPMFDMSRRGLDSAMSALRK